MPKLKLAIIGVGLIGGSLGMCLKDRLGDEIYITGMCRTQASMDKAVELGAVDFASSDPEQVVKEADIIFLSTLYCKWCLWWRSCCPLLNREQ